MRKRLKFEDAVEILKEKAATDNIKEMEVILEVAEWMNVVCQEKGYRGQRLKVQDILSDIRMLYTEKLVEEY